MGDGTSADSDVSAGGGRGPELKLELRTNTNPNDIKANALGRSVGVCDAHNAQVEIANGE